MTHNFWYGTFIFCMFAWPNVSFAQMPQTVSQNPNRQNDAALAPVQKDGLIFTLTDVGIHAASPAQEPLSTLAVKYSIVNQNPTKKINIGGEFPVTLMDNFQNQYRRVNTPTDYAEEIRRDNKNFPSLYPHEAIERVVFFEPPLRQSSILTFSLDAHAAGLAEAIVFSIPVNAIKGFQDFAKGEKASGTPSAQESKSAERWIKIVQPESGRVVFPGERVHIEVKAPAQTQSPRSIFVLIPSYMLKDERLIYHYDLMVPEDQRDSFSLVVIGRWDQDEHNNLTDIASDSVLLNVKARPE